MKRIVEGTVLIAFFSVALAADALNVELTQFLNGRSSARFRSSDANLIATLKKGTVGQVTDVSKMASGNFGVQIKIRSEGSLKDKTVWVYFDAENPGLALEDAKESGNRDPQLLRAYLQDFVDRKGNRAPTRKLEQKPVKATRDQPAAVESQLPKPAQVASSERKIQSDLDLQQALKCNAALDLVANPKRVRHFFNPLGYGFVAGNWAGKKGVFVYNGEKIKFLRESSGSPIEIAGEDGEVINYFGRTKKEMDRTFAESKDDVLDPRVRAAIANRLVERLRTYAAMIEKEKNDVPSAARKELIVALDRCQDVVSESWVASTALVLDESLFGRQGGSAPPIPHGARQREYEATPLE